MVNLYSLPNEVLANGHSYKIRTDFRVVLDLLTALSDKEMQGDTKEETAMIQAQLIRQIMFLDKVNNEDMQEAIKAVIEFIDMGLEKKSDKPSPRVMDWEQDATLIIPAVNRVLGREVRADAYCHWWTFLSAYMEIGECGFSHILTIRQKRAKGKKLEKWEEEYLRENADVVLLRDKLTEEEQKEQDAEEKAISDFFGK